MPFPSFGCLFYFIRCFFFLFSQFLGDLLEVEGLEQCFGNSSFRFEEEEEEEQRQRISIPSPEDKMPFLQMLQSIETPPVLFPLKQPNFQTLLRLQHLKKPWDISTYTLESGNKVQALEPESCVTHEMLDLHSPVKSETKDVQNPHFSPCMEVASSELQELNSKEPSCRENNSGSSFPWTTKHSMLSENHCFKSSPTVTKERKKRKRTRPGKNKDEVESQRMTHIAVERNRRRQMNDHLNSLRSLMPSSYVQRGDQASIIGGAIDFVKELEQLLQSLEATKRMRKTGKGIGLSSEGLFTQPTSCSIHGGGGDFEEETEEIKKLEAAEIEVTAIQNHVSLKVHCKRRPGQLLRAIVALEDLRLTVLHLNITSSQSTVFYSFNLKIEDDCKVGSADEISAAVHHIFNIINLS
ncbi:hypothetical protein K2173_003421 [Erythroxylum novogranatense]|uniref:BHLH domain-containing protein n=1 Tax=Erythroxylum novogranatense TaxID=1862640 RepID=A0AAV8S8I7_9ROSI|nr:hypothetical protein K2173_003421 [Erythroxylum novogranatense]